MAISRSLVNSWRPGNRDISHSCFCFHIKSPGSGLWLFKEKWRVGVTSASGSISKCSLKVLKSLFPKVTDRLILSLLVGQDYWVIYFHRTDFEDGILWLLLHFYSFSNPSNLCSSGSIRSSSESFHSDLSIQCFCLFVCLFLFFFLQKSHLPALRLNISCL